RSRRKSPPASAIEHRANPRARRVSLRVDAAKRRVLVTRPSKVAKARAVAFMMERADWLCERWAELPPPMPFIEGGEIPVRGVMHVLERESERGDRPRIVRDDRPTLVVPSPEDSFDIRVRRYLKSLAERSLIARVEVHAQALGVTTGRVRVKDT